MLAKSARPSSCRRPTIKYGVDYDGNGHVDLRHSVPDVLASTANLLKTNGWRAGGSYEEGSANFDAMPGMESGGDLSQDRWLFCRPAGAGDADRHDAVRFF